MDRQLNNWLKSYIYFTRFHEAQEQFHKWTALTVLSSAVNRNCWMDAGYFKVFPNLYVLFIGPSGVGKSSSSGLGIELLQSTSLKLNIYKDSITSAALLKFMSESPIQMEIEGKRVLKTPTLLYASELGNLLSLRTGAEELTLLLTELFNKTGDHEDRTNSRGNIKIVKPCLNFHGCCFPGWIDERLPSISLRSGFFGRMLTIRASSKRHHAPTTILGENDLILRDQLIADLEVVGALYGEMVWEKEAKVVWQKWYNSQPLDFEALSDHIEVEGFIARKPQFVQRLAMLSSISRKDSDLIITIKDLEFALIMIKECEIVAKSLGVQTQDSRGMEALKRSIRKLCITKDTLEIDLRDVMMRVSKHMNKKKLMEYIEQLHLEGFASLVGRKLRVSLDTVEHLIVKNSNKLEGSK